MSSPVLRRLGAAAVCALGLAAPSAAYETDQYSNRLTPIRDAQPVLDQRVNEALAQVAARWRGPEDRVRFAIEVWRELGGLHWVDRIERFAMRSPAVEKLPQYRWKSVYHGAPVWVRRVNYFFGVGATIRLAGSLVGSDKLGHFFSQGLKYYRSHLDGWSESRIAGRGRFNERWIFGQLTTSIYSNSDLVSNWEGYLFYRGLFEDGVVAGKPALVRFEKGGARLARAFTWSDHVNDYWDEALLPSYWNPTLERAMRPSIEALCPDFERVPSAFVPRDEAALAERYAGIGLRLATQNRIDNICAAVAAADLAKPAHE